MKTDRTPGEHLRSPTSVDPPEPRFHRTPSPAPMAKIAETLVARPRRSGRRQSRGGAGLEDVIQEEVKVEKREGDGNCCLFAFALVCKGWRKAQLKVGGPLRTRVWCGPRGPRGGNSGWGSRLFI